MPVVFYRSKKSIGRSRCVFGCLIVIVVGGKTTAGKRIIVVVVAVAVTGWHQIEDKVLFMTITVYQSEIAKDAEGSARQGS